MNSPSSLALNVTFVVLEGAELSPLSFIGVSSTLGKGGLAVGGRTAFGLSAFRLILAPNPSKLELNLRTLPPLGGGVGASDDDEEEEDGVVLL